MLLSCTLSGTLAIVHSQVHCHIVHVNGGFPSAVRYAAEWDAAICLPHSSDISNLMSCIFVPDVGGAIGESLPECVLFQLAGWCSQRCWACTSASSV
jgi:hypothetical protein